MFRSALTVVLVVSAVAGTPATADASTSPVPEIIAVSVGSTTALYGVVAALGAGGNETSSRAWQVHAHLAGSLNLTCAMGELIVGIAGERETFVAMGLVNLVVGATSIAMGVLNAHQPSVTATPWVSTGRDGDARAGMVFSGSF